MITTTQTSLKIYLISIVLALITCMVGIFSKSTQVQASNGKETLHNSEGILGLCGIPSSDACADMGEPSDEIHHNLIGWGLNQFGSPIVPPSGDLTKRYQLLGGDNSLILNVPQANIEYTLLTEVEDGGCDDSFEIFVNGIGPVYVYIADPNLEAALLHTIDISPSLITSTSVEITYRNIASDNCGLAAVFNAKLQAPTQCEIPFYWQRDPAWRDHPLRTNGQCSQDCSTIGACGCTLTSAAMLFSHFGNVTEPDELSDCMQNSACPFYWPTNCAGPGITWDPNVWNFSFSLLDQQLNQLNRPALVGMEKWNPAGNYFDTHWVLVISGQGNSASGYTMHDPWFEDGRYRNLSIRQQDGWVFTDIRAYNGQPSCNFKEIDTLGEIVSSVQAIQQKESNSSPPQNLLNLPSQSVNGTLWLYSATPMTMTLHLSATSSVGIVTNMQLWNADNPNPAWQPYAEYARISWSAGGSEIFARFRDNLGNISETTSDSMTPEFTPPPELRNKYWIPIMLKGP